MSSWQFLTHYEIARLNKAIKQTIPGKQGPLKFKQSLNNTYLTLAGTSAHQPVLPIPRPASLATCEYFDNIATYRSHQTPNLQWSDHPRSWQDFVTNFPWFQKKIHLIA